MDDLEFTPTEEKFFKACYAPAVTRRRQRRVLMAGLVALISPAVIGFRSQSWPWVAGLMMSYVVLTIWEKNAYGNGVLVYKSVVRKIQSRLEESEAAATQSQSKAD